SAHILEQLLKKGHDVVTTVRSEEKASKIRDSFPEYKDKLNVQIVPDIAKLDAFDEVVKIPGIEVVLHTASPFHFNFKDPKELLEPAINGTTGILKAIARSAPTVRRVVVTSSFAAILDEDKLSDPNTVFSEKSWNPVTAEDAHKNQATAYRASKKLAEKAAWDFVQDPKNGAKFDVVTVNPPMVYGPVQPFLASLDAINTSNERIVAAIQGKWKSAIPPTGAAFNWVDVRDVATAHVKAGLEIPEAGGHRLFTTQGRFSNRDIAAVIRKNFPEYADRLPGEEVEGGGYPEGNKIYGFDNEETRRILGIEWISLEQSIVDTVNSVKGFDV
ncbi:hypothetical protein GE09DRAFT_1235229, partial [Coniochaeta sp. 2T2.1]